MENFQEIDKLKMILFNKEQLMLFNLIAKPEIFIEQEEKEMHANNPGIMISSYLKGLDQRNDENLVDLAVYYNKIKQKNSDDLEGRLIKLIDVDMKKYFEV